MAGPAGGAYATVADFRQLFSQVPAGAATDALIAVHLARATEQVNRALGFAFADFGGAAQADFAVARGGATEIWPPVFAAGTLVAIGTLAGKATSAELVTAITDYADLGDGRLYRACGWPAGWYRATAQWGYGPVPADIVQVTLERAMNLFVGAQGGQFTDAVGVQGSGAVAYQRAWTNSQRDTLARVRADHGLFGVA